MKNTIRNLAVAAALLVAGAMPAGATVIFKAANTSNLNTTASWSGGVVPSTNDTATWDSTVTNANSSALGASMSWQGIVVTNPAGACTIADTASATLSLYAGGIDLSGATQNFTVNPNIAIKANQSWTVAGGRTLNMWALNGSRGVASSSANITLAQAGSGTATFIFQPGANTSIGYNDAGGNASYSGSWTFGSNTLTRTIRNGATTWGTGTLVLNGGTIGGWQGTWAWNNAIKLADGATSNIKDQNTTGATRYLKLESAIGNDTLGTGTLTFQTPALAGAFGAAGSQYGYILTGANTFTGGMTIDPGAFVRIGGDTAGSNTVGAGNSGAMAAALTIADNGQLTLTRNDAWTLGCSISGTGRVYVGHGSLTTSGQTVTLTNNNTYSGATTVNNGKLVGATGGSCANSAVAVASNATIGVKINSAGGTWSCSSLTLNAGTTTAQFDFGPITPDTAVAPLQVSNNVVNSGTLNVTIASGIFSTATNYPLIKAVNGSLTAGTLGTVSMPGGAAGTLTNDANTIYLVVTTVTPITYYWGAGSGAWDIGVNANWNNFDNGTTGANYADSYPVVFDDTTAGAAPFAVTLDTTVNPSNVTVSATNNYTISGSGTIAGAATVTKAGTGTLTLSTTNTYTGSTVINGGTLTIGSNGLLGSGVYAANITNNATFNYAGSASQTLSGAISGTGAMTASGTGTLTLSGANTYSGATSVNGGTLIVTNGSAIANNGTVNVANNATFQFDASETIGTLSTVAGSTVNANAGTLTFSGSSILGALTGGGTMVYSSAVGSASSQFTTSNALAFSGTLQLRGATVSSTPASMGSVFFWLNTANGSQLAGTSFALDTGSATTNGQDFVIGDWDGTSGNRTLTLSSLTGYGTLRSDAGNAGVRNLIVDQTGDTVFNGMILSHYSGAGASRTVAFEKRGSGSLTLANVVGFETASSGSGIAPLTITVNGGTLVLTAANTYTGSTTVNAGVLQIGNGGTSGTLGTNAVTVNSRLVFDRTDSVINNSPVSGTGTVVQAGSGTLTVGRFAGGNVAVNNGALVVNGDIGGGATVSNGTLTVNGSIGTGDVSVAANGTLGGTGLVCGVVTVGGTVAPGGTNGVGTLTVSNAVTFNSGSTFRVELGGTNETQYDALDMSLCPQDATINGGTLKVTLVNGYVPQAGDSFKLIRAFNIAPYPAVFPLTELPDLSASNLAWSVTNTGSELTLSVYSTASPTLSGYDAYSNLFALAGGPAGDANGDGWQNLAAYALGFDPTGAAHSGLSGGIVSGKLSLTFDVLDSRSDITYWAETSDTLMTNDSGWTWIWTNKPVQALAGPNAEVLTTSGETNTVRVSDANAGTNRFLRLRITRP